jgi:hypothetical protein
MRLRLIGSPVYLSLKASPGTLYVKATVNEAHLQMQIMPFIFNTLCHLVCRTGERSGYLAVPDGSLR